MDLLLYSVASMADHNINKREAEEEVNNIFLMRDSFSTTTIHLHQSIVTNLALLHLLLSYKWEVGLCG
jgi:hypothetical protein